MCAAAAASCREGGADGDIVLSTGELEGEYVDWRGAYRKLGII